MKRAAYIFAILSVLLLADGLYLQVSNNQQGCGCNGDSGTLFGGSTNIALSTGTEVLIGGGFLLIVAIIIWVVATMRARNPVGSESSQPAQAQPPAKVRPAQAQAATAQPGGESTAKTEVAAGQGQLRKESGDQR
jgi:hypothetical protein